VHRKRIVILGAAGRDFHNFNVVFRDDPGVEVVAFTATQIPGIADRRYPASLAGPLYPEGIPIHPEDRLEEICRALGVSEVTFAYSDVSHSHVMHLASRALATGADFTLLGPHRTMLRADVPVIAVSAVRTGCGKSPVTRWISRRLKARGIRVAVIRHPMPYGDLARQALQRFASRADLDEHQCTIEEREEYEPHLAEGTVVFAGTDYARILEAAETEADVILWDGGNNDFPFVRPDLHLVLVDALRPGHESGYHPGEAVLRSADVAIIAKSDSASPKIVSELASSVRLLNPTAPIVIGASPVTLSDPAAVRNHRVVVVEDGPTLAHGGMAFGAGYVAALEAGASKIVDPRPYATPALQELLARYPHLGPVLPAIGYEPAHLDALARTLDAVPADVIVSATPADLPSLMRLTKPVARVTYEFAETGETRLSSLLDAFVSDRLPLLPRRQREP